MRIADRIVMSGDQIKISKEGRHMPDIQLLHQDSANSGKGSCIEGHMYGQVSAAITSDGVSRSLPLKTERHPPPPKKEGDKTPDGDTLVVQKVNLVVSAVSSVSVSDKAVVALDAYFSKASAFLAADKAADGEGNCRLLLCGIIPINLHAYNCNT